MKCIEEQSTFLPNIAPRMISAVLLALLLVVPFTAAGKSAETEAYDLWHGHVRISYENLNLPGNEEMGLMGMHYAVDIDQHLYAGPGFFGAMSGERGGFFTGGFVSGLRYPVLGALSADAGLYVGGGGGGGAPQGGGLMVRAYGGLLYDLDAFSAGLHYSRVSFPNGDIRSGQLALALDMAFDDIRLKHDHTGEIALLLENASSSLGREIQFIPVRYTALYQIYYPRSGTMNKAGDADQDAINLVGFEFSRALNRQVYLAMQAAGAAGGTADGYAEVFLAGGYRIPVIERIGPVLSVFIDGRLAGGLAGGGNVDTGGGMTAKAGLGLSFLFVHDLSMDIRMGIVDAAGTFRAASIDLGISAALESASFGRPAAGGNLEERGLYVNRWTARIAAQRYAGVDAAMRKSGEAGDVSLVGAKLDKAIGNGPWYMSSQAYSAFDGNAGGYSSGMMGIGILTGGIAGSGARLFVEMLAGAAGGGGIAVGGGAVAYGAAGLRYVLDRSWGIDLSVGWIRAMHGPLDCPTYEAGISYRFGTAGRNPSGSAGTDR